MLDLNYPSTELEVLDKLKELFAEWKTQIGPDVFVEDGFYPYYFNQKIKVLFIGRESREMEGRNYIEVLFDAYKNKKIGCQSINTHFFHKRMIYIAYGLNNGMPLWQDIPYVSEIIHQFGVENGFSFAFMNLSKLSNENDNWEADWDLINQSCYKSNNEERNFFSDEIKLLSPDLIITMNLEEKYLKLCFENLDEKISDSNSLNTYNVKINHKNVLVMNTFHFAAPKKDDIKDFYLPICNSLKEHLREIYLKANFNKDSFDNTVLLYSLNDKV